MKLNYFYALVIVLSLGVLAMLGRIAVADKQIALQALQAEQRITENLAASTQRLEQEIDSSKQRLHQKFDALEKKLDRLESLLK